MNAPGTALPRAILATAVVLGLGLARSVSAQLQFTAISQTPEQSIQLTWASVTNETYEIDEADALGTNADGSTTWNQLYTEYPSQGTNTFWLDTGNYFATPEIVHPKYSPARFYRVVDLGPDTTPDEPLVTITGPTSGSVVSDMLTVTVGASTDQSFLSTSLFVDGQEMNEPDISTNWTDGTGVTNYVLDTYYLNTCEWLNGPHTIFATARCQSGASGTHDQATVLIGHSVSAFVPVTYSNLITAISFTQPFFAPEDGTTQQVTAIFAADVNWTLQIQDVNSNTVRTVTGSGGSMVFGWDGTDDNGTNLPVGTYTYLITAQTNGQIITNIVGGGGSGGGPPSPDFASSSSPSQSNATQSWAEPSDGSGIAVPLVIYPPGFDTNGLTVFEAPVSWNPMAESKSSPSSDSFTATDGSSGGGAMPDYSGASSQSTRAPVRPPIKPVRGRAGVYGVAYQTYSANGTGYTLNPPQNGLGLGPIPLEGNTAARSVFLYKPLPEYVREANNFMNEMRSANWSQGFAKADNQLGINDLRSSGANVFNTVKLGLLLLHGTYGTAQDFTENGAKEMYFPITSGKSAQYLRMSEMNLGGATTNGLSWMGILACNSLKQSDWNSMQSANVSPINGNLHLILGANATIWTYNHLAEKWALYITKGKTIGIPMPIEAAWYAAAQDAYHQSGYHYTNTMFFAASGDAACRSDTLQTNSAPGGTSFYNSVQVWP